MSCTSTRQLHCNKKLPEEMLIAARVRGDDISSKADPTQIKPTAVTLISTFASLQTIHDEFLQLREELRSRQELARSQGYHDGWHQGYEDARAEAATLLLSEECMLNRLLKRAVELQTKIITSVTERILGESRQLSLENVVQRVEQAIRETLPGDCGELRVSAQLPESIRGEIAASLARRYPHRWTLTIDHSLEPGDLHLRTPQGTYILEASLQCAALCEALSRDPAVGDHLYRDILRNELRNELGLSFDAAR